jgi:dTDP-glucose 4,6-dehydratase
VADRPGHDRRYAVNDAKARAELGYTPQRSFEAGLKATVAWYLSRPRFTFPAGATPC